MRRHYLGYDQMTPQSSGILLGTIGLAIPGIPGLYKLWKWAVNRSVQADATYDFVKAMATNHLPHLYHTQELICRHLGIEVTEPPKIEYYSPKEGD